MKPHIDAVSLAIPDLDQEVVTPAALIRKKEGKQLNQ
jgi:hypothetical protein